VSASDGTTTPPTATPADPMAWLPTSDTPLGTAAAAYAAHGFRVVPLWRIVRTAGKPFRCECGDAECVEGGPSHKHVGKHPCPKAWQKKASDDPDTVRDWWRRAPQRNIGLVMGGEGRLVALDVDGPDGRASLAELEAKHGTLPATLSSASGRDDGGEHRIFRLPTHLDLARIKNRKFLPGLDVKANNGQIACAPSEHNTGRIYTWTVRVEVAEMPEWLYAAMCMATTSPATTPTPTPATKSRPLAPNSSATVRYVMRALDKACQDIATTSEGSRNEKLFAKACTVLEYFHGEQMDHAEAIDELTAAGMSCGLSKGEVRKVLSNAWDRAKQGPGKRVPALVPKNGGSTTATNAGELPPGAPSPAGYPADWQEADPAHDQDPDTTEPLAWQGVLKRNGEGRIKGCEYNAALILRHDSRFKGHIAFDEFSMRALYREQPFSDADEVEILIAMQEHYSVDFCASHVNAALKVITNENRVDTLKMAFDALPTWDGTERLDTMAVQFLRTPIESEDERTYARIVVRKFLIQAVARAHEPGCQADATLMLIGAQGCRKSTFAKVLGGAFFTDQVANINDEQKSANSLHGKHVVELAEMACFKGISPQRIKQWLSLGADHYTPKYVRNAVTVLRRCVFIATTNHVTPLTDTTGERRFWPLHVGAIDIEGLRDVMPQIWAEAVAAYRAGEKWHLTDAEAKLAKDAQAAASSPSAWEDLIADYLESTTRKPQPTMVDIITGALCLEKGKVSPREQHLIADIMAKLEWEQVRCRAGGKRERGWRKKEPKPNAETGGPATISPGQHRASSFVNDSEHLSTGSTGSIKVRKPTEGESAQRAENTRARNTSSLGESLEGGGLAGPVGQQELTADNHTDYAGPAVDQSVGHRARQRANEGAETPFADWVDAELGEGDPKP